MNGEVVQFMAHFPSNLIFGWCINKGQNIQLCQTKYKVALLFDITMRIL